MSLIALSVSESDDFALNKHLFLCVDILMAAKSACLPEFFMHVHNAISKNFGNKYFLISISLYAHLFNQNTVNNVKY